MRIGRPLAGPTHTRKPLVWANSSPSAGVVAYPMARFLRGLEKQHDLLDRQCIWCLNAFYILASVIHFIEIASIANCELDACRS